jgi:hypothetical protein
LVPVSSWNRTSIYIFLIQLYASLHFYGLHFTALLCQSPNKPIHHTKWNMFTVIGLEKKTAVWFRRIITESEVWRLELSLSWMWDELHIVSEIQFLDKWDISDYLPEFLWWPNELRNAWESILEKCSTKRVFLFAMEISSLFT